jgi:molecular chaperone HtpG
MDKTFSAVSGDINIHTENIFPIIKKWLYSDHDIFIRELVSNAFDAITKRKKIAAAEQLGDVPAGLIELVLDPEAKTLTIRDNGLGMDAEDIQTYINQIAFSGAEDFVKKYQAQDEQNPIIGHFGLGFYSAFMVADKVEIYSLSYKEGAQPVHWICEGSTRFSLDLGQKSEVGTEVVLHINDENALYLKENKITDLVQKYADFLPCDIQVNGKTVNDQNPLWDKNPTDITNEEYKDFYSKLFPMSPEPLFWIHLNVDFPFHLKGILYVPKMMHEMDTTKGQVKLFCQHVFVSDSTKDIFPEFLTLLQGAIDSVDIPLNVSRSMLQINPDVQKISRHIVKKVADKIQELFKTDKPTFEKHWEDIHAFIKYGMMNNNEFFDKLKDVVIFESSNGFSTSIPEYIERNKEKLKQNVMYCSNKAAQASYVQLCQQQGLEVIFIQSVIDTHFIQFLESKDPTIKFIAVDTQLSDHLIDKSKQLLEDPEQIKQEKETISSLFKDIVDSDQIKIQVEPLKTSQVPAMILESETIKRFKQMSKLMQREVPAFNDFTLIINSESPLIRSLITAQAQQKDPEFIKNLAQHIVDLAKMNHQPLAGQPLQDFVQRSVGLLEKLV